MIKTCLFVLLVCLTISNNISAQPCSHKAAKLVSRLTNTSNEDIFADYVSFVYLSYDVLNQTCFKHSVNANYCADTFSYITNTTDQAFEAIG